MKITIKEQVYQEYDKEQIQYEKMVFGNTLPSRQIKTDDKMNRDYLNYEYYLDDDEYFGCTRGWLIESQ